MIKLEIQYTDKSINQFYWDEDNRLSDEESTLIFTLLDSLISGKVKAISPTMESK